MKRKILLGSMLVLILLLSMPSIPAIQQKSIEEGIKQDIQERLDTFNLNELNNIKESSKEIKWGDFFLNILKFIIVFRACRGLTFMLYSLPFSDLNLPILSQILYLRGLMLFAPAWLIIKNLF